MSTKMPSSLKPTSTPEDIPMDTQQQLVYQEAKTYLGQPASSFLTPLFSVVRVTNGIPDEIFHRSSSQVAASPSNTSGFAVAAPPPASPPPSPFRFGQPPSWTLDLAVSFPGTAANSNTGARQLQDAVAQLDGIEKKEQALVFQSQLTQQLTSLVTQERYSDATAALQGLTVLGQAVPRRVCQHPFRKNDIVWVCRTCQADETCVLCHNCFSQSNHEGHDINFYHAQAGGCCDCGDPDAWDPAGFCPHHGPGVAASADDNESLLPPNLVHRVRGVVPAVVDWMVQTIAANSDVAYNRANPKQPPKLNNAKSGADADDEEEIPMDESDGMDVDQEDQSDGDNDDGNFYIGDEDEISVDGMNFPALNNPNLMTPPRTHIFSPSAASASRSNREEVDATQSQQNRKLAEDLGLLGSSGRGIYLVLHADDIHVKHQVVEALRSFWGSGMFLSDMLLIKIAEALKQYGQLIVWGNSEICSELGETQSHLWMDGDKVVSTRVGDLVLDHVNRLSRHGMFCSILTYDELLLEERAVAVLQWLSAVARSCDPLCQTVAECILPNRHLVPLLKADFKMNSRATKTWYSLLLTLLAVPTFKSHLAAAYCDTYRAVTAKYARGMGVLERSGYTLSVQFLNRVAYVVDLVEGRDLLGKLGKSLLDTMLVAARTRDSHGRLNSNHFVMAHRRYSPCISDLKCVLNVSGMPRVTACSGGTFMGDWIAALSVAQFMDPQTWRHWNQGHVEDESRGWVGAFNASISLGSLFERLLGWKDEEESPIKDSESPLSKNLMTCVELTIHILLNGIGPWQRRELRLYKSTDRSSVLWVPYRSCPSSLPFSTVSARRGTVLAMRQVPISQMTSFSFHLPLHRFVASMLRELCLRTNEAERGMTNLMQHIRGLPNNTGEIDEIILGLMEFPLLVLSRVAQVRSDLWKRNGTGLNDQVLNYAEPPFCRNMRDADLLLTQFSVLCRVRNLSSDSRHGDAGVSFLCNLLLHRFGIFDFVGFESAPKADINRYRDEVDQAFYPPESSPRDSQDEIILPWAYSPARDTSTFMKLLEEFLHFIIVFITELPPPVPKDEEDQTIQAKNRLVREVVHRLASGPKTHSELSEVHHVLSNWDNILLNEEGTKINPDDATGAALGVVLEEVADRRVVRSGRPEPDKWELKSSAWESYDPSFFHISSRCHQTAAESRPKPKTDSQKRFGWRPKPFAPVPAPAHPFFDRLRRDVTAEASVIAVAYKVLHLHCRKEMKDLSGLNGKDFYESREMSETALARALHLLTLGAYAWGNAQHDDTDWREKGGGSPGGLFYDWADDRQLAPTASDWIAAALLQNPRDLLCCDWYEGEESILVLLQRLALSAGVSGVFIAQDNCVRSGAAWLCEFAVKYSKAAASILAPSEKKAEGIGNDDQEESEFAKRKRLAKERQLKAMAKMKAQAEKFASTINDDGKDEDISPSLLTPQRPIRAGSFGSAVSSASSAMTTEEDSSHVPNFVALASDVDSIDLANIPPRLMQSRPRCIICNDEESCDGKAFDRDEYDDGEGSRKKSRRKTENALGFVGYCQASTVLKGGGGAPPSDSSSSAASFRRFVGVHVALCGHAVHSECCESYLATVSRRDDRVAKREEFKCPLCQRLSNCLVPFIDVGRDWVDPPSSLPVSTANSGRLKGRADDTEQVGMSPLSGLRAVSLESYLSRTSWWISRRSDNFVWDGHSAFVTRTTVESSVQDSCEIEETRKGERKRRSLRKKDLYAAWNAMMRTPRLVHRKLRPRASFTSKDIKSTLETPSGEDSSGETIVLRRLMDQIAEIAYKADGRRLGESVLQESFGEFRHFLVERFAYGIANGNRDSGDWPLCMFGNSISDSKRQEMSREKLLAKLLMSIQSFTYSSSCEGFEARRAFRRWVTTTGAGKKVLESSTVLSRFGIESIDCDNYLVVLPKPSFSGDGLQAFDGRIGKLRFLALAIISAAGAVSADLVQLMLPFPTVKHVLSFDMQPERAPVALPLLLGHVLTHVTAAACASCGRSRAQSDGIDLFQVPLSSLDDNQMHDFAKGVDAVAEDIHGFMKLGLLARVLQTLLHRLSIPVVGVSNPQALLTCLESFSSTAKTTIATYEASWMNSCLKLLEAAFSGLPPGPQAENVRTPSYIDFKEACSLAAECSVSFLSEFGLILQILVPGVMSRYPATESPIPEVGFSSCPSLATYERLRARFRLETLGEMLGSRSAREVVQNWYLSACEHTSSGLSGNGDEFDLRRRLRQTLGYSGTDWPTGGTLDSSEPNSMLRKDQKVDDSQEQPHDVGMGHRDSLPGEGLRDDMFRRESTRALVTFSSKKSVPLLGGPMPTSDGDGKPPGPKVAVIPTSYTDLYAELGSLLPDCEQTAVCLVCGEVLNASGRGECTKHSYKCGAGAGMFFLLQECSGLIMHKSKAAYIHSPYVDSHGETPQYRGRPLNLDLNRYDHLREMWYGHEVRQQVVAERGTSRQVILPDFY